MTTPPTDPAAGLPVPAPRAPRKKPAHRKRRLLLIAGGVAVLGAVAVWQATSELPFVTHREVMATALALENAKSAAALRTLLAFDDPVPRIALPGIPDPPTDVADWIQEHKTRHHFTYLDAADERTKHTRLRFRVHTVLERANGENELLLLDYHELKIDRRAGKVVVVDVRSLLCGGWFTELAQEREHIAASMSSPAGQAFTAALAGTDARGMLAAFRALDEPARHAIGNGSALLGALAARDVGAAREPVFREAVTELRTLHPDSRTIDLWLLYHVQAHGVDDETRGDAIHAVERLAPRVEDGDWMRSALKKLKG
jgi:hypothetical protein